MRSLLLAGAMLVSLNAHAFFTAKQDKPDPYARRHYTAADLPAAKRAKKMKSKLPSDAEIAAEIARENAGAAPAVHKVKKTEVKKTAAVEQPVETVQPITRRPAVQSLHPSIAVCKIPPKPSSEQRFLISDSDGFEACNEHGGQVTAGNEDDRSLTNVKDASELKSSKH